MWRPSALSEEREHLATVPVLQNYRYQAIALLAAVAAIVFWFR